MSNHPPSQNRIRERRQFLGLSQEELAGLAGISRIGLGAIELGRLTPSVNAALALSKALACNVERLFGQEPSNRVAQWVSEPEKYPCRYWQAEVNGKYCAYQAVSHRMFCCRHDGVARGPNDLSASTSLTGRKLSPEHRSKVVATLRRRPVAPNEIHAA